METKDGTISVASAFAGHQEGTSFRLVSLILTALLDMANLTNKDLGCFQHLLFSVMGGPLKRTCLLTLFCIKQLYERGITSFYQKR